MTRECAAETIRTIVPRNHLVEASYGESVLCVMMSSWPEDATCSVCDGGCEIWKTTQVYCLDALPCVGINIAGVTCTVSELCSLPEEKCIPTFSL